MTRWYLTAAVPVIILALPIPAHAERAMRACDGSAVVALQDGYFLSASDEDNVIRLYKQGATATLVSRFDLSTFLKPELNRRKRPKEVDIEGVARIGTTLYWIGSHGNDRQGNTEESRNRLFATRLSGEGTAIKVAPVGAPYTELHSAFATLPAQFAAALGPTVRRLAPNAGGINIEGLAATPEAALLIGFRSPLVEGKALVVRLTNPGDVVEKQAKPVLDAPVLLDLGGLAIRALEPKANPKEGYWIMAGPVKDEGPSVLYEWPLGGAPTRVSTVQVPQAGGPVEGLMSRGASTLLAARDTGIVEGTDCKDAPTDAQFFTVDTLID